jgi:hypothetical protein
MKCTSAQCQNQPIVSQSAGQITNSIEMKGSAAAIGGVSRTNTEPFTKSCPGGGSAMMPRWSTAQTGAITSVPTISGLGFVIGSQALRSGTDFGIVSRRCSLNNRWPRSYRVAIERWTCGDDRVKLGWNKERTYRWPPVPSS